ncbi:MAG: mechanosensitive ion channel protein MscS [Candidatus Poribacteria bacterium]|nr:MAG: mechanosensitive ion channel protein MscS [Candidatus Poribacteria bacterium]
MNPFAPTTSTPSGPPTPFVLGDLIALLLGIVVAVFLYRYVRKRMYRYFQRRRLSQVRALQIDSLFRYGYFLVVGLFLLGAWGDSLSAIGLTIGFAVTLLGWMIRPYILNFAGWLMLIVIRPYRIGDRIVFNGVTGDVKDISVFYTFVEQVGGTVSGEERSGRAVLIPNQYLFSSTIVNYSFDDPYILDEVAVRVTYDSDIFRAEQVLVEAARSVLQELIELTGTDPYVRHEFIPSGVVSRVRYRVPPQRRQELSSLIVEEIYRQFAKEPRVRFCFVQSVGLLSSKDKEELYPPPQFPGYSITLIRRGAQLAQGSLQRELPPENGR